MRAVKRVLPVTDGYRGDRFVVREDGRRWATPLLVALMAIEATDIVFATDSIPAVFGVTDDAFVVFTSNAFAVLGLRSLYFVFTAAADRFEYLRYGLAVLLVFIGVKLLIDPVVHLSVVVSLAAIVVVLGTSILASLWWPAAPGRPGAAAGRSVFDLTALHVSSPLSYVVAFTLPALDAVVPVLPSETVIIALGAASAGSADPRLGLLILLAVGRRVRRRQRVLPDRPPVRGLGQPAVLRRGKGRPPEAVGGNRPYPVRRSADPGVPVHPRRKDRCHPHLRGHRLFPSIVRGCHRRGRRDLGRLRLLPRTAGRRGVQGPAVVRAGARPGHRHGGHRRDRGRPAVHRVAPASSGRCRRGGDGRTEPPAEAAGGQESVG